MLKNYHHEIVNAVHTVANYCAEIKKCAKQSEAKPLLSKLSYGMNNILFSPKNIFALMFMV